MTPGGAGEPAAAPAPDDADENVTHSGLVALAGRPNVGKSTLVNALVGGKVAIVSDRPQTTRRAIRGVRTAGGSQIVLVDLPGVQRPRDALTERMAARVRQELADCDAALFVLNGEQGVGPGDRFIAAALKNVRREPGAGRARPVEDAPSGLADGDGMGGVPVTIAVNKVDRLDRARTASALQQAADLDVAEHIFPVSALTGEGVQPLLEHLLAQMPPGPLMFPPQDVSDQPLSLRLAELVREAAIRRTFQEVPHAVEVVVEEIELLRTGLQRVRAVIWVETDSQKGILVGRGGRTIKAIGSAARREIERELGAHGEPAAGGLPAARGEPAAGGGTPTRVHLDLSVRVRRGWRADEALLDRLGIV